MNTKYELIKDDPSFPPVRLSDDKTLYRIRAKRNVRDGVNAGDIGGYVETEANLSLSDESWILDEARVYDTAYVSDDACVSGGASVCDSAWIKGRKTMITRESKVCGDAIVVNSIVTDGSEVSGHARVINSTISNKSVISDNSVVFGACIRWGHNWGINERGWGLNCRKIMHNE